MSNDTLSISTHLIVQNAKRLHITSTIDETGKIITFTHKKKKKLYIYQKFSDLTFPAYHICKYKDLTKKFLDTAGFSVPAGADFTTDQLPTAEVFLKKNSHNGPFVVKPSYGFQGQSVFLPIRTTPELRRAVKKIAKTFDHFIVEQMAQGEDFRFLSTKKKLLGVTRRVPAHVTGDGASTISELIKQKNQNPPREYSHKHPLRELVLDKEALLLLKKQKLSPSSIPDAGTIAYTRSASNISQGGDSVDMTDLIHPAYKTLLPKIVKSVPGLPYAGVDILTKDITKDPLKEGYTILELNSSPSLDIHHMPYKGKKRNVSKEILKEIFKIS